MVKNILFDLDGTLLHMENQKEFVKMYFEALCKRFCKPLGMTPEQLTRGVWKGTEDMFYNDGGCTNREIFWNSFSQGCNADMRKYERDFDDFYRNEFSYAKKATGDNPLAGKCTELLKQKGYRLVLATNPVFPYAATESRIKWAGVNPELFELVTVYDNSCFCKPNPGYYIEILQKLGMKAEECLMVGNDVEEDMCTANMGMETYLVTDCLENKKKQDYSRFRQGSFNDFYEFAKTLPEV